MSPEWPERFNSAAEGWLQAMGVTITHATDEEVRAELTVGPEHLQSYGIVHGGVHCGLIESLASIGAALYALPGAMHSGFAQFAAFDQDAIDNRTFLARGRLKLPILAVGGQKSFGPMMATVMRAAGDDVTEGIVPDSGHWIMEENPQATIKLVRGFLVP